MIHRAENHFVGVNVESLYALSMDVNILGYTEYIVQSGTSHVTRKDAQCKREITEKM